MFSEDMFAEDYNSPSSTAKMIANQVESIAHEGKMTINQGKMIANQ